MLAERITIVQGPDAAFAAITLLGIKELQQKTAEVLIEQKYLNTLLSPQPVTPAVIDALHQEGLTPYPASYSETPTNIVSIEDARRARGLLQDETVLQSSLSPAEQRNLGRGIAILKWQEEQAKISGNKQLAKIAESKRTILKNTLIQLNLGLATHIANKYQNRGLSLEDLRQEGIIGLMAAVDKYNYRVAAFSTYARNLIEGAIKRALTNQGSLIRLPVYLLDNRASNAKKTRKQEPDPKKAQQLIDRCTNIASIDEIVDRSMIGIEPFSSIYPSPKPAEITRRDRMAVLVNTALDILDQREKQVIYARFGISGEAKTLEEIAIEIKKSVGAVKYILAKAILKLQQSSDPAVLALQEYLSQK